MTIEEKKVKILYNSLIKYQWGKNIEEDEKSNPFWEIKDVCNFIKKKAKKDTIRDLTGNRFCFLEKFYIETSDDGSREVIYGFIKSARNQFRPNLIDKKTGKERPNPKTLSEGDIEKTHFGIVLDTNLNEVFFIHEFNYYGVTFRNMLEYFKYFSKEYARKTDLPLNFTLKHYVIPKKDFLAVLKSMKRVKVADVYINKKILGSDALNLSNRFVNVKEQVKLSIGSKMRETIRSTAVDVFNLFNSNDDNSISKVRIEGQDANGNDLIIDTDFMSKLDFITVDRKSDTGELVTSQVYNGLKLLIEEI